MNKDITPMDTYNRDYGKKPFVIDIDRATSNNTYFRKVIWTGDNMQLVLMSLPAYENIGKEMHPDVEQFIKVEQGTAYISMGDSENSMNFSKIMKPGYSAIIPARVWHDIKNTAQTDLKIYTIYAKPEHPAGTIDMTKQMAIEREEHN